MFDEYSSGDTRLPSPLLQKIPGNLQPFVPVCLTRHASSVVRPSRMPRHWPTAHVEADEPGFARDALFAPREHLRAARDDNRAPPEHGGAARDALWVSREDFPAPRRISGLLGTSAAPREDFRAARGGARLLATSAGLLASTSGVLRGCGSDGMRRLDGAGGRQEPERAARA
jgi:hypothetical protein